MGLSIRAYARHRGVSHVAVKKAIDTGRITQGADGTIILSKPIGSGNRTLRHRASHRLRQKSRSHRKHHVPLLRNRRPNRLRRHSLLAAPRFCRRARSTRSSRHRPTRCAWRGSRVIWLIARRPSPMCFDWPAPNAMRGSTGRHASQRRWPQNSKWMPMLCMSRSRRPCVST